MHVRLSARVGAYACLGVALAMAALALRGTQTPDDASAPRQEMAASADPLQARLLRCQQAGEAAGSDRDCLAAWAENRRRFLGLGRARPAEPAPAVNHTETAADPTAPVANAAQPRED